MAHHSDVGGIAPGSVAVHATEIYQEGLRIPLSKLVDAGVENTMLLRADRGQHPPAGARARRPAGSARGVPRRGARADGAARAVRRATRTSTWTSCSASPSG